jgi:hypothetical protein
MLALKDQPKTMQELAHVTGGSAAHVSQAIDVLVAAGYLRDMDPPEALLDRGAGADRS